MQRLSRLHLHISTLSGTIPPTMGSMLNLQYLYVHPTATPCGAGRCEVVQYSGTAFCRACTNFCDTSTRPSRVQEKAPPVLAQLLPWAHLHSVRSQLPGLQVHLTRWQGAR
ncbi:hypothetical protein CLOM_g14490 [Closterium sp. NIES-68]|nr:hypothetical protein CLOM_g14490 [Closterium sp. NIES-68]